MSNRTEHCVKNRFFGLLAQHSLIPIKKIKKDVDYLNCEFIIKAIKYYQNLYEIHANKSCIENEWNECFEEHGDIL